MVSPLWPNDFKDLLVTQHGTDEGERLYQIYKGAFSAGYQEDFSSATALQDISYIEKLSKKQPIAIHFYQGEHQDNPNHQFFKLFNRDVPLPLSDILPILENLGLKVLQQRPYTVKKEQDPIFITEFSVELNQDPEIFQQEDIQRLFEEALIHLIQGDAENDTLNQLVLRAQMKWDEIIILRAYVKYLRQIKINYSPEFMMKTLVKQSPISRQLIRLFFNLFNPLEEELSESNIKAASSEILQSIEKIVNLDEDRILRYFYHLLWATKRTNYFIPGKKEKNLAFKLKSSEIPDLPLPLPLYEIFVYGVCFEGIHLRASKVARGGIRWSDRLEDFRTEVLGLMKAQKVKNVVIVPSGAKGGFVLKCLPLNATREIIQNEVTNCYKSFISALLDLTDNIIAEKVVRPDKVKCYDEEDAYLVVAADKGTATFSDIGNQIAKDYGFWLGDAFASGGSTGYDHKKIGITARGAWESVKRHFTELGMDPHKDVFTAVGIGDMSGDVCGNGLLYTPKMKLIAAFDHRHIFLDPNPDPDISYQERQRLFNLPFSSWEDYNASLISTGGGVYRRDLKSIPIQAAVKEILQITQDELAPNDLVKAILKAPVTLLWNGGIGTFVKANEERNAEVGDRTNDFIRVDGAELRCKVVAEGGNLGFTQLGRVEYALNGGFINTDFIDNSAGVDCSDHEVNIKILLNQEMAKGSLNETERNKILAEMTEEVAELVLKNNYFQSLALSTSLVDINKQIDFFSYYLKEKSNRGQINLTVEFLPDSKKLLERKVIDQGLTRPELAVLLAYEKIAIKEAILQSKLPENPYFAKQVFALFPQYLHKNYAKQVEAHPLHREIIATYMSNEVVNRMGTTFIFGIQEETLAPINEILRAYTISAKIFRLEEIRAEILQHENRIPAQQLYQMFDYIRQLIHLSTRWFIFNCPIKNDLDTIINLYQEGTDILFDLIPNLMRGTTKVYSDNLSRQFIEEGIDQNVAIRVATYRAMYNALNVIEIANKNNFDVASTARYYFLIGERFYFLWFRDQLLSDFTNSFMINYRARVNFRDNIDLQQKLLTTLIMKQASGGKEPEEEIKLWMKKNKEMMSQLAKIIEPLTTQEKPEFISLFIALGELSNLVKMKTFCQL